MTFHQVIVYHIDKSIDNFKNNLFIRLLGFVNLSEPKKYLDNLLESFISNKSETPISLLFGLKLIGKDQVFNHI